jgi:ribonuclease P protein component
LSFPFPKAARLLKKPQFQRVYQKGTKLFGKYILIHHNPASSLQSKLGISVPKRYGKSNDRNFFKRKIRESFRLFVQQSAQTDLIIQPIIPITQMNPEIIEKEFLELLEKLKLLH